MCQQYWARGKFETTFHVFQLEQDGRLREINRATCTIKTVNIAFDCT